jgi:hypothetical protein
MRPGRPGDKVPPLTEEGCTVASALMPALGLLAAHLLRRRRGANRPSPAAAEHWSPLLRCSREWKESAPCASHRRSRGPGERGAFRGEGTRARAWGRGPQGTRGSRACASALSGLGAGFSRGGGTRVSSRHAHLDAASPRVSRALGRAFSISPGALGPCPPSGWGVEGRNGRSVTLAGGRGRGKGTRTAPGAAPTRAWEPRVHRGPQPHSRTRVPRPASPVLPWARQRSYRAHAVEVAQKPFQMRPMLSAGRRPWVRGQRRRPSAPEKEKRQGQPPILQPRWRKPCSLRSHVPSKEGFQRTSSSRRSRTPAAQSASSIA